MPGWLDVSSPQWSSGCFGRRVLHAADGAILGAGVVLQRIQSQSGNVPAAFDKQVRFQDLLGARVVETVVDLVWLGCGNCDACAPRPYGVDIGWACSALWPEGLGQMTLLKNNCTLFNTLLNYYELLLIIIACYCTFGYIWPSGQAKHQAERHAGTKSIHKPLMEPGGATLRGFGGVHWQARHGATWPKAVEKPCKSRGKTVQRVRRDSNCHTQHWTWFADICPTWSNSAVYWCCFQRSYDFSIPDCSWELLSVPHQMPFGYFRILFGVTRSHRAVCISWWAAVGISWWAYRKVQPDDLSFPKTFCIPGKHSWSSEWRTGQTSCFIMFHVLCGISSVLRWNVSPTIVQLISVRWIDATDSKALLPRVELSVFLHTIAGIYKTIFRFFRKHKKHVLPIRIVCPFARESTIESL